MKIRIRITKEGNLRFISHLEYSRTINRALRRSKIPVAFSQGFNPHIKMSLASALGVGISSVCEYAEIELAESIDLEEAKKRLRKNLPEGIRLIDADIVSKKEKKLMASVEGAEYKVLFSNCRDQLIKQAVDKYNVTEEVLYNKINPSKNKKKVINMKEFVNKIDIIYKDNSVILTFDTVITPQGTVKVFDVLLALKECENFLADIEHVFITRILLYKGNKESLIC